MSRASASVCCQWQLTSHVCSVDTVWLMGRQRLAIDAWLGAGLCVIEVVPAACVCGTNYMIDWWVLFDGDEMPRGRKFVPSADKDGCWVSIAPIAISTLVAIVSFAMLVGNNCWKLITKTKVGQIIWSLLWVSCALRSWIWVLCMCHMNGLCQSCEETALRWRAVTWQPHEFHGYMRRSLLDWWTGSS